MHRKVRHLAAVELKSESFLCKWALLSLVASSLSALEDDCVRSDLCHVLAAAKVMLIAVSSRETPIIAFSVAIAGVEVQPLPGLSAQTVAGVVWAQIQF